MTVLAIAPAHNTGAKKDATGAFQPEALAFAKMHAGRRMLFDNTAPAKARFANVIDYLTPHRNVECVAFFCHGLKTGLQIGATMRNVHALAATLRTCGVRSVALYACDAARDLDADQHDDLDDGDAGAGGFASALSGALPGVPVYAHPTTAHTTRNPHVRVFTGGGDGAWLVEPGSPWWRHWRAALQDDAALRLGFPLWSRERLVVELASRAAAA